MGRRVPRRAAACARAAARCRPRHRDRDPGHGVTCPGGTARDRSRRGPRGAARIHGRPASPRAVLARYAPARAEPGRPPHRHRAPGDGRRSGPGMGRRSRQARAWLSLAGERRVRGAR